VVRTLTSRLLHQIDKERVLSHTNARFGPTLFHTIYIWNTTRDRNSGVQSETHPSLARGVASLTVASLKKSIEDKNGTKKSLELIIAVATK